MNLAFRLLAALLMFACGDEEAEPSCPVSDGPHWQKVTMPRTLEIVDSAYPRESAHAEGSRLWFWTGAGATRWDLPSDEWQQIPAFEGIELYDGPFVRVIAGSLVVWGDRNANDDPANDWPSARLEGFTYREGSGWRPIAAAPAELPLDFTDALYDEARLYVFTFGAGSSVYRIGIYDVAEDSWRHVESPLAAEDIRPFWTSDVHSWATAKGKLLLADKYNGVWILDSTSLEWTHLPAVVSRGQLHSLTATKDRVFAWSDASEGVEILLDDLHVRRLGVPEKLYGAPREAGERVVFEPASSSGEPTGWQIYDTKSDTFSRVGVDCAPESFGTPRANLMVMTDHGLFVSGALDWGDGPSYDRGTYPREARLLVFPDSTPLRP